MDFQKLSATPAKLAYYPDASRWSGVDTFNLECTPVNLDNLSCTPVNIECSGVHPGGLRDPHRGSEEGGFNADDVKKKESYVVWRAIICPADENVECGIFSGKL